MRRGVFSILLSMLLLAQALAFSDDRAPEEFSYDDLIHLIQSHKIHSIDQLLPLLPPSYRSHYALVYRSGSPQGASLKDPRVIMYGSDAKTVITFNGDPKQPGYNQLEVMQFNDGTRQFEFRELTFPNPSPSLEVNPARCARCHGDHPGAGLRPSWSQYPSWSGVYGENDDSLSASGQTHSYDDFLKSKAENPRYRYLVSPPGAPAAYPFTTASAGGAVIYRPNARLTFLLDTLNTERQAALLSKPPYSSAVLPYIFASMRCHRDPESIKDIEKILADKLDPSLTDDDDDADTDLLADKIVSAVGLSARDWSMSYLGSPGDDYLSDPYSYFEGLVDSGNFTAKRLADQLAAKNAQFKAVYDPAPNPIYGQLGNDTQGLPVVDPDLLKSMVAGGGALDFPLMRNFPPSSDYSLMYPPVTTDAPVCGVLRNLLAQEAQSAVQPCVTPEGGTELITPTLEQMASASANINSQVRKSQQSNPTLTNCTKCHTSGYAPYIPFNDPTALRSALSEKLPSGRTLLNEIRYRLSPNAPPEDRMPQGDAPGVSRDQVAAAVEKYLNSLVSTGPSF
jgi:cytochrome c553